MYVCLIYVLYTSKSFTVGDYIFLKSSNNFASTQFLVCTRIASFLALKSSRLQATWLHEKYG